MPSPGASVTRNGSLITPNANNPAPRRLGAGRKTPRTHLAPRLFFWTELETCREGGFNLLQSSAVGKQLMLAKKGKRRLGKSTLHKAFLRLLFPWAQALLGG